MTVIQETAHDINYVQRLWQKQRKIYTRLLRGQNGL